MNGGSGGVGLNLMGCKGRKWSHNHANANNHLDCDHQQEKHGCD